MLEHWANNLVVAGSILSLTILKKYKNVLKNQKVKNIFKKLKKSFLNFKLGLYKRGHSILLSWTSYLFNHRLQYLRFHPLDKRHLRISPKCFLELDTSRMFCVIHLTTYSACVCKVQTYVDDKTKGEQEDKFYVLSMRNTQRKSLHMLQTHSTAPTIFIGHKKCHRIFFT